MKNTLILMLGSMMFFCFTSCERDSATLPCRATDGNDTAVFTGSQPIPLFSSCASGIQARIANLNDSRCPANANCVWAGTIYADLELIDRFTIRLQQNVQKDTVFQAQQYSFTLTNATPYPGLGNPADPKNVFIRIVRK